MSATEIIEQIKALPPQERKQVVEFVHEAVKSTAPQVQGTREERFVRAADTVFRKHEEALRRLAQ